MSDSPIEPGLVETRDLPAAYVPGHSVFKYVAADIHADARSTAHVRTLLVARPEIFASPPRPDQFFAISPKTGPDSRCLK